MNRQHCSGSQSTYYSIGSRSMKLSAQLAALLSVLMGSPACPQRPFPSTVTLSRQSSQQMAPFHFSVCCVCLHSYSWLKSVQCLRSL